MIVLSLLFALLFVCLFFLFFGFFFNFLNNLNVFWLIFIKRFNTGENFDAVGRRFSIEVK